MNVNQRMFDTFEITNKPLRLGVVLLVGKFPLVYMYMYLFFFCLGRFWILYILTPYCCGSGPV